MSPCCPLCSSPSAQPRGERQRCPGPTWLLPPVLSCTRLRDMEQLMAKHWKKPPRKLQRPSAISSCGDRAALGNTSPASGCEKFELGLRPGRGPCTSERHLVAVHFVAVLKGEDLGQGDADGVAHHSNGESVARHLPKVADVRGHGRLQPTAETGRRGSEGPPWAGSAPGRPPSGPAHPLGMSPTTEMPNLAFRLTP